MEDEDLRQSPQLLRSAIGGRLFAPVHKKRSRLFRQPPFIACRPATTAIFRLRIWNRQGATCFRIKKLTLENARLIIVHIRENDREDPGSARIFFLGVNIMTKQIRILGIAGSLRRGSYNRFALRAATELVPEGATIEVFELDGIPLFNQDEEQEPPAKVAEFKQKIRDADAILFVTPEYNYSIPGVLKNAIDWASRPYGDSAWDGKPVAIMGASVGGIATARAQYHLRQMLVFLNMHAINRPEVMIGNCADVFDADGTLKDEKTRGLIRDLIKSLVDWTRRIG